MKNRALEPGILKIFRFFLLIQLLLIMVNVTAHSRRGILTDCPWCAVIFGCANIVLLLGYISFNKLQKYLGRFYLPIALVYAAVFSIVIQNFFLEIRFSPFDGSSEETAWQLFLFLFIPLVLISWQYDLKAVIAYCIFTGFLDYFLMSCGRDEFYLIAATYRRLIFIRVLSFLIAGYIISNIMKQFREQRAALQKSNRELAHYASTLEQLTVSRERNRMAQELHDTLAHTLSGIAVQLEAVQSLWKVNADEAQVMLSQSLVTTRNGLTETRRALRALRASPLEDLGLVLALQNLAQAASERAGFRLIWQVPDQLPKLPPDFEQGVYRIAQEIFENIVRHAGAKEVVVKWVNKSDLITLSMSDDGVGFMPSEMDNNHHHGLTGMRERAQMLGGELEVTSQPGEGTSIILSVKVQNGKSIDM
ncbi:MAG: sensor histidine kinase [Anaerolineales bacterium]|nr:sensor histidine kinase [Anaerolineales bacterium]